MPRPIGDPTAPIARAYEIFVDLGDTANMATIEMARIMVTSFIGPDYVPPKRDDLRRLIRMYREAGTLMFVAHTQLMVAGVDYADGDYETALGTIIESMDSAELAGDSFAMAWGLRWFAAASVRLGDPELGARLAGTAEAALQRMGGTWPENPFFKDKAEDLARDVLGARFDAIFESGKLMGLVEAAETARANAARRGDAKQAPN